MWKNYWGISLLSVVGKILARDLPKCLLNKITMFYLSHRVVSEPIRALLTWSLLRDNYRNAALNGTSLCTKWLSPILTNVFVRISHTALSKLLAESGFPNKFANIFYHFKDNRDSVDGSLTNAFSVPSVINKNTSFLPALFSLSFTAVLEEDLHCYSSSVLDTRGTFLASPASEQASG